MAEMFSDARSPKNWTKIVEQLQRELKKEKEKRTKIEKETRENLHSELEALWNARSKIQWLEKENGELYSKLKELRKKRIRKDAERMKSTKVQTLGRIWRKYWNIWIENNFSCICIR